MLFLGSSAEEGRDEKNTQKIRRNSMNRKIGVRSVLASILLVIAILAASFSFTPLQRVFAPSSPGHTYPIVNTNSTDPTTSCTSTYGGVSSTGMGVKITPQNLTTVIIMATPVVGTNYSIAGIVFYLWRATNANTPACGTTYPNLPGTVIAEWLLPINTGMSLSYIVPISSPFNYRDSGLTVGTQYDYYLTFGVNYASGSTGAIKIVLFGGTNIAESSIIAMEE
jgi:hypothetical protein